MPEIGLEGHLCWCLNRVYLWVREWNAGGVNGSSVLITQYISELVLLQ